MPLQLRNSIAASRWNAALGAGILFALACPPYEQAWAAWLVPGLLLVGTRRLSPVRAFVAGLLYALVIGGLVGNWLPGTAAAALGISTAAARPVVYALLLLNPGIPCALLVAAYAYACRRIGAADRPIVGAFLWVASEWLRSTSFGWELLAHTQYKATWLIQVADLGGAYLVSFIIALVSISIAELVAQRAWEKLSLPALAGRLALPTASLLVAVGYGASATAVYGPTTIDAAASYSSAPAERPVSVYPIAYGTPELPIAYTRPALRLREVSTVRSGDAGEMTVTPILCLDLLNGGLVRDLVRDGAEVLINNCRVPWMSGLETGAAKQHLSMAVFRAVETRRFVLRASSDADAHMISPFGLAYDEPPMGTQLTLRTGMTRYVSLGDAWILVGLGLCAVTTARGRTHGRA